MFTDTMKALDKLMECVQDDVDSVEASKESWKDLRDDIKNERVKAFALSLAGRLTDYRQDAAEAIKSNFAAVKNAVTAFVTAAPEAGTAEVIDAVRTIAHSMSDEEAALYLSNYSNNYLAHAAMLETLHGAGRLKDVGHTPANRVLEAINTQEALLLRTVEQYDGSSKYLPTLYASVDSSPLVGLSQRVNGFLKGDLTNTTGWE